MSFDPNLRLNLWPDHDEMRAVVNTVAAHATVVMPGLGEGRLLTGHDEPDAIADFYLRRRRPRGGGQARRRRRSGLVTADGQTARSRPFHGHPDRHRRGRRRVRRRLPRRRTHRQRSLQQRVDKAAAVGALVTTRRGDLAAMPTRAEVDALLNSQRHRLRLNLCNDVRIRHGRSRHRLRRYAMARSSPLTRTY